MRLYPIKDRVIIDPHRDVGVKKSDGGIFLPESRREQGMRVGVILAVGPGVRQKQEICPGRTAFFSPRFCGQELVLSNGKKVLIMGEEDILGIEVKEEHSADANR